MSYLTSNIVPWLSVVTAIGGIVSLFFSIRFLIASRREREATAKEREAAMRKEMLEATEVIARLCERCRKLWNENRTIQCRVPPAERPDDCPLNGKEPAA